MQVISSAPFLIETPLGSQLQSCQRGHQWPKQDFIKYAVFLSYNHSLDGIISEMDFKSWSFFRRLSLFVQSKNPNQCRIFHKKMINAHESINSIISFLKTTIHKFQEWESHYASALHNFRTSLIREQDEAKAHKLNNVPTVNVIEPDSEADALVEDKKHEELGPTDVGYLDQPEMPKRTSSFAPQRVGRPSFSFFGMNDRQEDINDDLAMLSKKQLGSQKVMAPAAQPNKRDDQWRDCHSNFMDYMGKLNTLMNGSQFD